MPEHTPLALGFDVGGTNTKLGLVSLDGSITHFRHFTTDAHGDSPEPFLANLTGNITELLELAKGDVLGVGMSVHGWTNEDRTAPILCFNTPALHNVPLTKLIGERFGLPTVLNMDLTAHALAEYTFGSGRGTNRFMCVALGTGVGAGVVINGEPLRFVGGSAGDNGHIILQPGGPSCSQGCKGCAEALIGVAGIERLGHAAYGRNITAFEVITAAREGTSPHAIEVMSKIGDYVGQLFASLSVIYLPDRIALTGGTSEAGSIILDAAKARFNELAGQYHQLFDKYAGDYYNGVDIVLGEMRGETGVVGAVVELLQPYLESQKTP